MHHLISQIYNDLPATARNQSSEPAHGSFQKLEGISCIAESAVPVPIFTLCFTRCDTFFCQRSGHSRLDLNCNLHPHGVIQTTFMDNLRVAEHATKTSIARVT